jgi:hypothetical protein
MRLVLRPLALFIEIQNGQIDDTRYLVSKFDDLYFQKMKGCNVPVCRKKAKPATLVPGTLF